MTGYTGDPQQRRLCGGAQPGIELTDWCGTGPPLLFVHGFSHNRQVWRDVAEGLAERFRPIALDLRGHGDSGWCPEARYAPADLADDLLRVLDALEIERVIAVGHSLGGIAATLFATAHPDRVRALALVDTGPALKLGGMEFVARDVSASFRSYDSRQEFFELLRATLRFAPDACVARLAEATLVERIDGRFEPKLDPGWLQTPTDPEMGPDLETQLWSSLESLTCPVLLVRGGVSAMLDAEVARAMIGRIPGDARLVTIEKAGHSVMLDAGLELLRVLDESLDRWCGSA